MWFVANARSGRETESAQTQTGSHNLEGEPNMESSHATALQSKHAGLDAKLRDEMSRPVPDQTTIQALKRMKLRIKEELAAQ